jgi:AcrR family transcriptional regulator
MQATSVPNRQQIRREASYRALLDSALCLFQERGYAATTVNDIVEPTAYSPGAFYYHFANKTDCFWHVVEYREQLRGEWWPIPAGMTPANATLTDVIAQTLGRLSESLRGHTAWTMVLVDFYQQHRDDPEMQTRLAALYERWREHVGQFLRNLQAGGWIDPARDPDLLAVQVLAFQQGLSTHRRVFSFDELSTASTDALTRLLGPTP